MFNRMRRGWELTKKSWAVIRSHPKLTKLPLTGGALALLAVLVFCGPGALLLLLDDTAATVGAVVLIAIGAYLASFSVVYFNVALAAAADQALHGQDPDLGTAHAVARSRIGIIAKWALVSAVVSAFFSLLRDKGGVAGDIGATVGGAVWSLVTFLVVPVLAFEGIGPIEAIKRSAGLFRQRWGQQVTGNVVIGGIAGLVVLLGAVIAAIGVALVASGNGAGAASGVVVFLIGLVLVVAGMVFSGAVRGVFGVALYRWVADDQAVAPFTPQDLDGAARVR
jgi:Family of unknown function (DUF6159)